MSYPAWWNETEDDVMSRLLSKVDKKWDRRQGGFIYDVLKPLAIERSEGRKELKTWYYNGFAQYAKGTDLDVIVEARTPLVRYPARKSQGKVTVWGNEGTKLIKGAKYVSVRYELDKKIIEYVQLEEAVIGANGSVTVNIECVTPGEIGNTGPGTIELMESTFGVSNVSNSERITGGEEAERDEDFASRYFTWLRESSNSGNIGDYIRWGLAIKDIGGVLVHPVANGEGTVKLLICDSSFMPASDLLVKGVKEIIAPTDKLGDGKSPIGASVSVISATAVPINLSIKVSSLDGIDDIKKVLIKEITAYLRACNKLYWRDNASRQSILREPYAISHLKAGAIAVDAFGLIQAKELLMNGQQKDVVVNYGQIAVLGEVTINAT
ncbi:baseplate J/gp47 family protein [Bacillus sp. FSL W8-0519]|uniref:baseplate J/gp47 family protein n=1 Tax=Bacillus sp. FSL W8-0519 TaxID=2954624 RepID=UPI0030F5B7E8